jgi:hypothetical protein
MIKDEIRELFYISNRKGVFGAVPDRPILYVCGW